MRTSADDDAMKREWVAQQLVDNEWRFVSKVPDYAERALRKFGPPGRVVSVQPPMKMEALPAYLNFDPHALSPLVVETYRLVRL